MLVMREIARTLMPSVINSNTLTAASTLVVWTPSGFWLASVNVAPQARQRYRAVRAFVNPKRLAVPCSHFLHVMIGLLRGRRAGPIIELRSELCGPNRAVWIGPGCC